MINIQKYTEKHWLLHLVSRGFNERTVARGEPPKALRGNRRYRLPAEKAASAMKTLCFLSRKESFLPEFFCKKKPPLLCTIAGKCVYSH